MPETTCAVCGAELEWTDCWHCLGDEAFHDCGEDTCCCADPDDDLNEQCQECNGQGGYLECPCLPHSNEQMEAYYATGGKGG